MFFPYSTYIWFVMRCSLLGFSVHVKSSEHSLQKKPMCVMLWFYLKQFILDYCLIWHVNLYTWDEKWKAKLAQSDHFRFPNAFKIDKNVRLFTLWLCNIVYIYCPTCVPSESVFTLWATITKLWFICLSIICTWREMHICICLYKLNLKLIGKTILFNRLFCL